MAQKWLKFLSNCRFTVGMRGGASIADPYGRLYASSTSKQSRHLLCNRPIGDSGFLRRRDGKNTFSAVSPRLLESAATRTCRVLKRNDYLGILTPWEDYIPLENDLRNVEDVLSQMRDLGQASQIADNAHKKLVASGPFSSSHLVASATRGNCADSKGELSEVWQQLKLLNVRLGEVCNRGLEDLHDASISLIKESLLRKVGPNSPTAKNVIREVMRWGFTDWYTELIQMIGNQKITQRDPWVWRPVPTAPDENY